MQQPSANVFNQAFGPVSYEEQQEATIPKGLLKKVKLSTKEMVGG